MSTLSVSGDTPRSNTLGRSVAKHALRARERLFQNIGRTDKTIDQIFEEYHVRFRTHESQAGRLNREAKNYASCVRAMQNASRGLMEAVLESYDPDWPNRDQLMMQAQAAEMLWDDMTAKVNDQIASPIAAFHGQFVAMRKKVDKRARKLVDYDSCRHAYDTLRNNPKRYDELKVERAKEQLEDAFQTYYQLNTELYDDLPNICDQRINFFVSNYQTLFAIEKLFHGELTAVMRQLGDSLEPLADDSRKGTFKTRRLHLMGDDADLPPLQQMSTLKRSGSFLGFIQGTLRRNPSTKVDSRLPSPASAKPPVPVAHDPNYEELTFKRQQEAAASKRKSHIESETDEAARAAIERYHAEPAEIPVKDPTPAPPPAQDDNLYSIPPGATTSNLPMGVLYKVRATYKYAAEDGDELSFEKGEVIQVVPYEAEDDHEDGWLVGVKETTQEKGMFPANFTRPI